MRLADIKNRISIGASLLRLDGSCPGFQLLGMSGCCLDAPGRLRFVDDDPAIILRFTHAMFGLGEADGRPCLLILDATPSRPNARGKLYLDRGDGFGEDRVIEWRYEPGGSTAIALGDPAGIRRLRLDPDDRAGGWLKLRRLSTRPLTTAELVVLEVHRPALRSTPDGRDGPATVDALHRLCFGRGAKPAGAAVLLPDPATEVLLAIIDDDGGRLDALAASPGMPRCDVAVLARRPGDAMRESCAARGVPLLTLEPQTTTAEAGNIALRIAEQRGSPFLLLAEGATRFETAVLPEMLAAFAQDDTLAAAAPAQLVGDGKGTARLAQRSAWHVAEGRFAPDFAALPGDPRWIEADYCDAGCTMLRVAAARAVGGFDEAFDGALALADLCFKLREAGHTIAALPRAQVSVAEAPPVSGVAARAFRRRHGGYGVSLGDDLSLRGDGWLAATLPPRLAADGLVDPRRPRLAAVEAPETSVLFLHGDTPPPREEWLRAPRAHRTVLTFYPALAKRLAAAGADAHAVPPGVDIDTYAPEGAADRLHGGFTVLHWCERDPADVLAAWQAFREGEGGDREAQLLLIGPGVAGRIIGKTARRTADALLADCPVERLQLRQPTLPFDPFAMARLLRGTDLVVTDGADAFPLLHAMGCGVPTLSRRGGAAAAWLHPSAITFGPGEAGDGLAAMLRRCRALPAAERAGIVDAGLAWVRARFTTRRLSFALRKVLAGLQERTALRSEALQEADAGPPMVERARRLESKSAGGPVAPEPFDAFDAAFYVATQPDVADAGLDPLSHYVDHGWIEGRRPAAALTTQQWITGNPAVRRALLRRADELREAARTGGRSGGEACRPAASPTLAPALSEEDCLCGEAKRDGVLFVGYVEAALGLGEALRGTLRALDESELPYAIYPFNRHVETRFLAPFLRHRYDLASGYRINVFEMAPDHLADALKDLGLRRVGGSVNILRGYWELPELPDPWRPALAAIDEIWAPTRYVAAMFAAACDRPVTLVPPLVDVTRGMKHDRAHFALPATPFLFVFTFDFNSHAARKNPLGALEAFARAFPRGREAGCEDVGLVIKSVGPGSAAPWIKAAIDAAAAADPRIRLIERCLDRDELLSLIAVADCYVSLHRAEGFGLGMAEAMLLGRPVIGTAWSGNADFLDDGTGYPIPFTLRRLKDGEYPFSGGQRWAEPDLEAAAAAMRDVLANKPERERRAAAGRAFVADRYGPEAVRRAIGERVATILERRHPAHRDDQMVATEPPSTR